MEEMIPPILLMLVIGGVAGYFAGHIVKKVSGKGLTIIVFIFIILALAYTGSLNFDIESITANISSFIAILAPLGLAALLSSVPFMASFVAGLFVGFRRD
jgi:uncharacterized membrane protein (Fun14 family)